MLRSQKLTMIGWFDYPIFFWIFWKHFLNTQNWGNVHALTQRPLLFCLFPLTKCSSGDKCQWFTRIHFRAPFTPELHLTWRFIFAFWFLPLHFYRRFVLVTQNKPQPAKPLPTALEKQLLKARFPKQTRKHILIREEATPIPRRHSTPNVSRAPSVSDYVV